MLAIVVSVVATFLGVVVAPARADTTVNSNADLLNSPTAMQYVFSREAMLVMYQLGVEQDKKFNLQPDCKQTYRVKPIGTVVVKPFAVPDDGRQNPRTGVWLTRYQLERCGESKTYNALFVANPQGGKPVPKAFYPGNGAAGPVLIQDAVMTAAAMALARAGLKECKNADVFDMRIKRPAHDVVENGKTIRGVWEETWTFRACGRMVDIDMNFLPDADGGGTSFHTGAVKLQPIAAE
ncbi:hypothetical protein [Pandoraea aquatica]|nr:hypothetical protein [Pandoraea aquatica]